MNLGGDYYTEADLASIGFKRLGKNIRIHSRASIYCPENISLGDHVRIDDFAVVIGRGGIELGNHVAIGTHCFIAARHRVVMEDFTALAAGVKIYTCVDDYSGEFLTNPTVPAEFTGGSTGAVRLCKHSIVGVGSVILPGCTLHEGTSVGALSLVTRSIGPWGVYFGSPAKRLWARKQGLLNLEARLRELESNERRCPEPT